MKTTLITTTTGQRLLSRTKQGASALNEIHIILAEDGNLFSEEVTDLLKDYDVLRHKTKQARRSNSPHGFLQGLQQAGNDQIQSCALFFRDIDKLSAVMFAKVNKVKSADQ